MFREGAKYFADVSLLEGLSLLKLTVKSDPTFSSTLQKDLRLYVKR